HFYAMQFIEGQTLAAVIHDLRQLAGLHTAGNGASAVAARGLAREMVSTRWTPLKRCRGESSWSPQLAEQVDATCDRFESAWKAAGAMSERPKIEDYVEALAAPERPILLRELVLLDVHYRRLHREDP